MDGKVHSIEDACGHYLAERHLREGRRRHGGVRDEEDGILGLPCEAPRGAQEQSDGARNGVCLIGASVDREEQFAPVHHRFIFWPSRPGQVLLAIDAVCDGWRSEG